MKNSVMKNMCYLLKVLWQKDKGTFCTMTLHILCGVIVPFLGVLIPSIIIRQLLQNSELITFIEVVGIVLLLYGVLQGLLSYLQEYNDFAYIHMRGTYFVTMVYLSRAHLDLTVLEDDEMKKMLEDAVEAIQSNTNGVEGMYHKFIEFAMSFLGLILYAITSSGLSIWLVLGLFLLVILEYACFTKARNFEDSHRNELDGYLIRARYLDHIAYDTSAGKDIRMFQLQDWINEKFDHVNTLIKRIRTKDYSVYMLVDTVAILLDLVRDIACYGFLIYRLTQGMKVDQFVFYLGIVSGFSLWFKSLGESYALLSSENVLVNRMLTALHIPNKMHHGTGEKIKGTDITIVFDHVSFSYPNQQQKILDDVSFTLHSQEKIALVGVNGAGKSTIVKLILGFYAPDEGRILINGIDTRNLDVDDIYQHITGIFQESMIMSYSIAENVSMCDLQDTDRDRVIACLKQAGLWDYVSKLEKKEVSHLYKDVEEDGIQLSGGQIQKLLLARALYRDFGCLLLDEPTAALDALAEKEMYESYHKLTKGKSSLFISHRLSSTRFCDHILVLNRGKIVEQGTHEELIRCNGIYSEMFQAQSKYYEEEGETHEVSAGN